MAYSLELRKNENTYSATRAEAEKIIKRAKPGSLFYVAIRTDLRFNGDEEKYFRDAGASYVSISKSEALRLAADLLSEVMEERGARLPIRSYVRDGYKRGSTTEKCWRTIYWIG
jgi:predicted aspartyl protease